MRSKCYYLEMWDTRRGGIKGEGSRKTPKWKGKKSRRGGRGGMRIATASVREKKKVCKALQNYRSSSVRAKGADYRFLKHILRFVGYHISFVSRNREFWPITSWRTIRTEVSADATCSLAYTCDSTSILVPSSLESYPPRLLRTQRKGEITSRNCLRIQKYIIGCRGL